MKRDTNTNTPHDLDLIALALLVADHGCRSDIECYAKRCTDAKGDYYDLTRAQVAGNATPEDEAHILTVAQNAARYIDARGDVFPWRMVRVDGVQHLVRFKPKGRTA